MKKSELKQLIKEEIYKVLNENNTIDEGWKENILVGLASLAGSLGGIKAQDIAQNTSPKGKTEVSYATNTTYQVLIGYLVELSQAGNSSHSIERLGAINEARIYLETLRDGHTPKPLSNAAKVVLDYAIKETKNLSGFELKRLSDLGENVNTASYNE